MDTKDIFLNRDRSFIKLTEAGDYLSRVLRENLVIFDVDSSDTSVTYLSESGKIISCDYSLNEQEDICLKVVAVGNADDIFNDEKVDAVVTENISKFVASLSNSDYSEADDSFDSVMDSFRMRSRINETRYELNNKLSRFKEDSIIRDTFEFAKLNELRDKFVEFIAENAEAIEDSTDIMGAVKLGNAIRQTFDAPYVPYEDLEGQEFVASTAASTDLYEMVCRQELIGREILESKKSFSDIWCSHSSMTKLASCIYSNEKSIRTVVMEAIEEIPYFALSSKSNISEVLSYIFEVSDTDNVSKKDIREFVSKIFEMKKPVKKRLVEGLNKKYGININNLKFVPSFGSLADEHSKLFESLAELSDSPILTENLKEFGKFLNGKKGIEILDVNDFILDVLEECEVGLFDSSDFLPESINLKDLSVEILNSFEVEEEEEDVIEEASAPAPVGEMESTTDEELEQAAVEDMDPVERQEADLEDPRLGDDEVKDIVKSLAAALGELDLESLKGAIEDDEEEVPEEEGEEEAIEDPEVEEDETGEDEEVA